MSTTVERAEVVTAAAFPASADVQAIIRLALAEDVGRGDVTSEATVSPDAVARADILQKAPGVVCGLPVVAEVWRELDPRVRVTPVVAEGSFDDRRRVVARLDGPASAILTGERTALNFLQRLSGVASVSRRAMQLVVGSHATVIDTRKTTPGMRVLEKYAVRVGGASNHRAGLDDGMLIKENHIRAAGGISPAVRAAQRRAAPGMLVEVEVTSLDELDEALAAGATLILLDNFSIDTLRAAVTHTRGRARLEASGGIHLTHSAGVLDFSLEVM